MLPMSRPATPLPIVAFLLVLCPLLAGCESTPNAGSLDQALENYSARRYAVAYSRATDALIGGKGAEKERAAYLAGLSASRLGRLDEAQRHLLTASRASDPTVAAMAKAQLGLVRLEQDRPREAARLFGEAAGGLSGTDAAQAARHAAAAFEQAGDAAAAATWTSIARRSVAIGEGVGSAAEPAGFALQVGAYLDRNGAERAATEAARVAAGAGLGSVRIVPKTNDRGQRLHVVQFGAFATRGEAHRPAGLPRCAHRRRAELTGRAGHPSPAHAHRRFGALSIGGPRRSMSTCCDPV
jgi:tetratricopeptide (TPR) repeat protein